MRRATEKLSRVTLRMRPPASCNYSKMTKRGAMGRREAARRAVLNAAMEAVERLGLALADLPEQGPGEVFVLTVTWRARRPPLDDDNAVAALKPYVDALIAPRGLRRGGSVSILYDDDKEHLERSWPKLEKVTNAKDEELIFELGRKV